MPPNFSWGNALNEWEWMIGKLPPKLLEELVFEGLGLGPEVILGPSVGEDSVAIDLGGGKVLVIHSDSVSAASTLLGWLSIHVVSNDIAVSGVRPKWMLVNVHMPPEEGLQGLKKVMVGVKQAARELGVTVVGGHTEFTPGLKSGITSSTAIGLGEASRIVRTGGASPGDAVIITKTAGVEGTSILSTDFRDILLRKGVAEETLRAGEEFIKQVSVVREALLLADAELPTSMHDPTEGGVLGGLTEIAYASGTTLRILKDKIPVARETRAMCEALGADPLKLISSGTLLATIPKEKVEEAINLLREHDVPAAVIGEVLERDGHLLEVCTKTACQYFDDVVVEDELIRLTAEFLR